MKIKLIFLAFLVLFNITSYSQMWASVDSVKISPDFPSINDSIRVISYLKVDTLWNYLSTEVYHNPYITNEIDIEPKFSACFEESGILESYIDTAYINPLNSGTYILKTQIALMIYDSGIGDYVNLFGDYKYDTISIGFTSNNIANKVSQNLIRLVMYTDKVLILNEARLSINSIELIESNGKILQIKDGTVDYIATNNLANGIYILRFIGSNFIFQKKFMIMN